MRASGTEDWALAFTLVFAVAFTATLQQARQGIEAKAAPTGQTPHYAMTITAKRLPAICKGDVATENALYCAPFLEAAVVIEVQETAASYAARTGAQDAALAYNR
jgi:hypothetical protein